MVSKLVQTVGTQYNEVISMKKLLVENILETNYTSHKPNTLSAHDDTQFTHLRAFVQFRIFITAPIADICTRTFTTELRDVVNYIFITVHRSNSIAITFYCKSLFPLDICKQGVSPSIIYNNSSFTDANVCRCRHVHRDIYPQTVSASYFLPLRPYHPSTSNLRRKYRTFCRCLFSARKRGK